MTTTATYQVTGMSCDHCVNAVKSEVGQLPGVTDVDVDLAAGSVTVTSDGPVDEGKFAEAIDEAGFEVASS